MKNLWWFMKIIFFKISKNFRTVISKLVTNFQNQVAQKYTDLWNLLGFTTCAWWSGFCFFDQEDNWLQQWSTLRTQVEYLSTIPDMVKPQILWYKISFCYRSQNVFLFDNAGTKLEDEFEIWFDKSVTDHQIFTMSFICPLLWCGFGFLSISKFAFLL